MDMVQLTIGDVPYASALREMLERSGAMPVRCVEIPDPEDDGVIVIDCAGLDRLPIPLANPERVVLITRNDSEHLSRAWNAGIRSVVFEEDPIGTAVLAIMAAGLRVSKAEPRYVGCDTARSGSGAPAGSTPGAPHARRKERG